MSEIPAGQPEAIFYLRLRYPEGAVGVMGPVSTGADGAEQELVLYSYDKQAMVGLLRDLASDAELGIERLTQQV